MMTLTATDDMIRVVTEWIEQGRITKSAYEHALAHGYTDADLIAKVERVRNTRASLAVQGAPLQFKPAAPVQNDTEPTPEWLAKHAEHVGRVTVGKGQVSALRQYRFRTIIEAHGDKIADHRRRAIGRYIQDACYEDRCRVANLHSNGGGSGGDRIGGLGNVPDHVRYAFNRHQWVNRQLRSISPDCHDAALALVTHQKRLANGKAYTLEEFGAEKIPAVIDRNRRWGISFGMVWALSGFLISLYRHCPYEAHAIDDRERALEAAE